MLQLAGKALKKVVKGFPAGKNARFLMYKITVSDHQPDRFAAMNAISGSDVYSVNQV